MALMVVEGTPGKWSLWATLPSALGAVADLYSIITAAAARAAELREAGSALKLILSP